MYLILLSHQSLLLLTDMLHMTHSSAAAATTARATALLPPPCARIGAADREKASPGLRASAAVEIGKVAYRCVELAQKRSMLEQYGLARFTFGERRLRSRR